MPSLKRANDFQALKNQGNFTHVNHWLAISYQQNSEGTMRWGWTISKKVGNAVVRNRLRRWGREFVRGIENDVDINFIFKQKGKNFYKELTHDEFKVSFKKVFERIRTND